ncbi:S1C family serine protease [Cohnella silvisoli]|uniref:Trypsin-like peptidase domain-containing protein n=1 Tax=Cohnella silvisoli TaxID=2873699 RepID=A0ABV1KZF4_9BACL|nr:trypsin-like peptidase domain-containing protein [Cohnella silvisoli]MCD9024817.1 trypsin-like peptidase domain-containing protein [Cohnella silvisoli]
MSLFDDDFYSTKMNKRSRIDRGSNSRGFRQGSMLRVAIISSVISSLLVVVLFVLLNGRGETQAEAKPALASGQSLVETSERIISAAEKVRPGVVSIINLTNQALEQQDGDQSLEDGELPANASLGSGVIYEKKDGKAYIITNAHVIQDAAEVQAVLVNGDKKEAKIIGKDIVTDLAVLEVDDKGIDTVVEIGDSEKLRDGEMVIAIGNPLGFGDSLTQGIVSNKKRVIPVSLNQDGIYDWEQEVIQIDAAINQGNSGGALVDLNGKLVGINSMKVADMGVEGIGFAIPIDNAMPILKSLMEKGKVIRPYMGVYTMDLGLYLDTPQASSDPQASDGEDGDTADSGDAADGSFETATPVIPDGVTEGLIVLEAVGPSLDAGLAFNDIIVELDDKPIGSTMDLRKYLYNSKKIGESLKVTYYRDGKKKTVEVQLAEKMEEEQK